MILENFFSIFFHFMCISFGLWVNSWYICMSFILDNGNMQKKVTAIVLHTIKYSDSSLIVQTYTEEEGRMSFFVRIPKSNKSKIKHMLFQPLAMLSLDIAVSQKQSLNRIVDAHLLFPYSTIYYHPVKLSLAMFIAEFLSKSLQEEAANKPLFAYLKSAVEWLDHCDEKQAANFHLVFLIRLTRFIGIYPNIEDYSDGDNFDLVNGSFSSVIPTHPHSLRNEEAELVGLMMRMNFDNMHFFRFSRNQRNRVVEVILAYYAIHLPGCADLKSLDVLRELFC